MKKVFVDGAAGTTGLQIHSRLAGRRGKDIELITLEESGRKELSARRNALNSADIVFLCLPDDAAREAVALIENPGVKVLDASTAHRVSDGWVYGLPELCAGQREKIAAAMRVAVPGCYASGFITLIRPLTESGVISPDAAVYAHAVSGYSGAGKQGILEYESVGRGAELDSPRAYGLTLSHKHLPEMTRYGGLTQTPVFNPLVADFYSGMCVYVPFITSQMKNRKTILELENLYKDYYGGQKLISVNKAGTYIAANALRGRDNMELFVTGNDERVLLSARYDNLGKGASGAAVQCMNLMLGIEETTGLFI